MRRRSLVAIALAGLAPTLITGCDWMPGKPTTAERPILSSHIATFDTLYGRYCAGCHGPTGQWGAARPLNDPLYLALVRTDILQQTIRQGIPGTAMPAFAESAGGSLTDQQINLLVEEMQTRWGHPQQFQDMKLPPYSLRDAIAAGSGPGDPQRGKTVYEAHCAHCHGPHGTGGLNGGSVVDGAYLALVSDQALRTAVIAGRPDLGMPDWRGATSHQPLTPQEITNVVAWLASHRQRVPEQSYATARNAPPLQDKAMKTSAQEQRGETQRQSRIPAERGHPSHD